MIMADEPQSLRACYADAESTRKALDSISDTNSDNYQENLASAIAKYEECVRIAAEVSLFSTNETLEDISSGDLQCVLSQTWVGDRLSNMTMTMTIDTFFHIFTPQACCSGLARSAKQSCYAHEGSWSAI